jgi:hypothetical protein
VEIFEGEKFLGQNRIFTHIYIFDLVTPTEAPSMFSLDSPHQKKLLKRYRPYS